MKAIFPEIKGLLQSLQSKVLELLREKEYGTNEFLRFSDKNKNLTPNST